ncbi:MAG: phosphatase PAP2 family protein [Acutalibacteraceae bacterium]|nr:phosphatase PAP2 family protein [Clostridia bacterium]MEE1278136.1 phosphatase PAP2 family protein [Acutalibacteraceae bacterium]
MKTKRNFSMAVCLILSFILWTVLISFIDVKPIGPQESCVGFAILNGFFHNLTGVNMTLYTITDWLGLVPVFVALMFAFLGLAQWIKRKNILKVDYSILTLGGFYLLVIALYILFENVVINYRPTLINGYLEVSYPSSTTLLVLTVMPTAIMQIKTRIKNKICRKTLCVSIALFIGFMVIGRLVSGVHWVTDIIGGALLSAGLVTLYYSVVNIKK